ncbi:hypothetical protein C461_06369 [Halorubrum aidingense JCM 13560]|uniref:Uncharacterized protein n=1 Tax=Halorubrum aidingense JCM 13560 TaxID=1230454 RepID=M0PF52_9EURY|nr:hypothetical protein [Halorubrum aidingense]EMA68184.1 hypothetical protein C461_06369 [Halorubrum aidingense JCM 13560]
MPSNDYDASVPGLLLVIVFQLGVCILLLSQIADAVREQGTLLGLAGYLIGGLVIAGALVTLFEGPE